MTTETQKKLKQLSSILNEAEAYGRTLGKLDFDMQCCAPREGLTLAGEDMAVIGKQVHKLTHSKRYESLVCDLYAAKGELPAAESAMISHLYRDYTKHKNESARFAFERDRAQRTAYGCWLKAKEQNDFSLFRDSLAKIVEFTKTGIRLRDEQPSTCYNGCLDDYEPGNTESQLDAFFEALRSRIVPLLQRIITEGKPIRRNFMSRPCSVAKQEAFSRYLLSVEGIREGTLVLMPTEHPFTNSFGPDDVRVTTHYFEENFISNVFSTLHEGGHALFMQNEPREFYACHAANGMTNAMHECISRFYENIVGKSEAMLTYLLPMLQKTSGDTFLDITARELYEAVNIAEPNLIRIEADELTYPLHILVRYELEKALINGEITVDDVPALWNDKYEQYLGIRPKTDSEGCLQDVHWATGDFGYFPSYALGNAYGAQILSAMQKEFDVFGEIGKGNLAAVLDWLRERVFSIASVKDPDAWIRAITGEPLNVEYYLTYLEEKFTKLYGLK